MSINRKNENEVLAVLDISDVVQIDIRESKVVQIYKGHKDSNFAVTHLNDTYFATGGTDVTT